MPGLLGVVKTCSLKEKKGEFHLALSRLSYSNDYIKDAIFEDDYIIASKIHQGILCKGDSLVTKHNQYCWVDGECYNFEEVKRAYRLEASTFQSLLLEANQKRNLVDVLSKIDGYFSAVIYCAETKTLKLISDRLGLKPLYYYIDGENLIWSSELKAFPVFSVHSNRVTDKSISQFLQIGYLVHNECWFENTYTLPSASIVEINENLTINKIRYWGWSNIKENNLTFEESVESIDSLLRKAVTKRVSDTGNRKIGISLSGGLDSRALYAYVDEPSLFPAFSFGKKKCDDITFATEVCEKLDVRQTVFELNENNWFEGRIKSIWNTDGRVNFIHLHVSPFHHEISKLIGINLNGFAGDLILGGGFIKDLDKRIHSNNIPEYYRSFQDEESCDFDFFALNKSDPFYIDMHVRNFTHIGVIDGSKHIEQRLPFIDNDLIESIYGLPDVYRKNNKLYSSILTEKHPELFKTIPWQKTGKPLGFSAREYLGKRYVDKSLQMLGFKYRNKHFADYYDWVKNSKNGEYVREIVFNPNSLISNIEEASNLRDLVRQKSKSPILLPNKRKEYFESLGKLFTLEIWLQQVKNNNYVPVL